MTTLAIALKDEIRRLARKEIKAQTANHVAGRRTISARNRPAQTTTTRAR